MLEWFKSVEMMDKDPRYPIFSFACRTKDVPALEGYIKDRYGFYRIGPHYQTGYQEIVVDFSTKKLQIHKK